MSGDLTGLETDILTQFGVKIRIDDLKNVDRMELEETIKDQLVKKYAEKEGMIGPNLLRETERMIMLNVIDNQWKDHLLSMDHLKEGINLRSYGQKDPLIEYKKESYVLFPGHDGPYRRRNHPLLVLLQRVEENAGPESNVPYPEVWNEEEEDDDGGEPAVVAVGSSAIEDRAAAQQAAQKAAQSSVIDFTRSIERKKEKELAALQFIGGESSVPKQPTLAPKKAVPTTLVHVGAGKIQEMLQQALTAGVRIAVLFLVSGIASAAVFPDKIGTFEKGTPASIGIPDRGLLDEFGLEATEQAEYKDGPQHFTATAWRFRDSTGALAFFESHRPSGATAAPLSKLVVSTSDGEVLAYGNYVFQFTGAVPESADLQPVYAQLPKFEASALPALMTFLPTAGPHSQFGTVRTRPRLAGPF